LIKVDPGGVATEHHREAGPRCPWHAANSRDASDLSPEPNGGCNRADG
jgi:hypothetical protein